MNGARQFWVHDLSPFLIRFPENPLGLEGIRYYGLAYLLGFLGAWLLLKAYDAKGKFRIDADARATLVTALIVGVIVGGRVGYVLLYDLTAFLENPLLLFRIDKGGMASHGGFIGVTVALFWFARSRGYRIFELGDVIVTVAPLGLMLGRVANFINGELWGKVSSVSWAVIFPKSPPAYHPEPGRFLPEPRHPSQLYEAALEGGLMLAYVQWRFWRSRPPAGQLAGEFLCGYALVRILGEIFREPDADLILGLSRGQFYSVLMLVAGIAVVYQARRLQRKQSTGT